MEDKRGNNSSRRSLTCVTELTKMGISSVPLSYVLPPMQRPNLGLTMINDLAISLPTIDFSLAHQPNHKPQIMEQVSFACKEMGLFQVINHGIPPSVLSDALDVATEFFDLPYEEKLSLASGDVHAPVRFGTSLNQVKDKVFYWRDFIKHYCHPISTN